MGKLWGCKSLVYMGIPMSCIFERGVWVQRRWQSSTCRALGTSYNLYEAPEANRGPLSVSGGVCTNAGSLHTACGLPQLRMEFVPDSSSIIVNINILDVLQLSMPT